MKAVLLFNPEAESVRDFYGFRVEETIFLSQVLQNSGEKLLMKVGDVIYREQGKNFYQTLIDIYGEPDSGSMHDEFLFQTALHSMVFAVLLEGVSVETVAGLHKALEGSDAYLGWRKPDYDDPVHQICFRDGLMPRYVVEGQKITVQSSGFSDENALPDHRRKELHGWGFREFGVAPSPFGI